MNADVPFDITTDVRIVGACVAHVFLLGRVLSGHLVTGSTVIDQFFDDSWIENLAMDARHVRVPEPSTVKFESTGRIFWMSFVVIVTVQGL